MPVSIIASNLHKDNEEMATLEAGKSSNLQGGEYTLRYQIQMASVCGPLNVITQAIASGAPDPVPALWATYSFQGDTDAYSYARTYKVERSTKSNTIYYLTVSFKPAKPGEMPNGGGSPIASVANPALRKPLFRFERDVSTRLKPHDKDSKVLTTKALTLYEDITEHDENHSLLVTEWNVANLGSVNDLIRTYERAVNSTTWTFQGRTYPPRTALVKDVDGGMQRTEGAYNYYHVVMRIAFSEKDGPYDRTWDEPLVEMSQHHFTKTSGQYDVDTNGFLKRTDAGTPVPLNDDGTRRSETQPVLITNWRVRREADFNLLPFMSL